MAGRTRSFSLLALAMLLALALLGCGVKGDPGLAWQPRKYPLPSPVKDLYAEVRDGVVWLVWTQPQTNTDGTSPARLDKYVIRYEVLEPAAPFCFTCPENLSRRVDIRPGETKGVVVRGERLEVPLITSRPDRKYVFVVLALDPDGFRGGESNLVIFNWPAGTITEPRGKK